MPDYSKTIIYKIQHEDNQELVYVGSTTEFTKRKCSHKNNSNNPNGKEYNLKLYKMIRDNGNWESFRMIQLKEFPCNNRREAEAEEDKVMLELKANMNDRRASRTDKEYYEDNKDKIKEWREKNKERITDYHKQYRKDNKEQRLQKDKKYYENNKEKLLDYHKQYREDNKEQIIQKKKEYYENNKEKLLEKITCECGCVVNKMSLLRHKKTKKHIELLNETTKQ